MIRSLIFLIYAIASSLILLAIFFFLLFLGRWGAHLGAKLWSWNIIMAAKYILGIKYEVKGKRPKHPVVYASRHESAWETIFLQMILPRPVFILKRELLWIPLFGLFMMVAGYIGVDRSKGSKALKKMVVDAKASLAKGNNIIIFPEGTRVKPGQKASIKPGVIAIYTMAENMEIIPVSLNSGQFWGRNSFIKKPGKITVTFHPSLKHGLGKKEFAEKLAEAITS